MAASRIRWAFDGTIAYWYNSVTHVITGTYTSVNRYILDGDQYSSSVVGSSDTQGAFLANFPCEVQIEKVIYKTNATRTCSFKISNDSTDGFDGSWTTVNSDTTVAYSYQTFIFSSIVSARWLKCTVDTGSYGFNMYCMHIFGMYQSPLFEFWNNAADAEFTADYPLSLANAPNDADYAGSLNFKIKNTDSSTHSYSLSIIEVKYNADAIITNYFKLSTDGGSTKLTTVTVSSLGAGNFSGSIGIYGDVTKANNPANGNHYFAVHVTVTA
jgi:hypothetical protein